MPVLIVDIQIKKILLYIYLLLLRFQLDLRQRINCHHRRLQFILAADIKRRLTTLCNGQVLTLYTTFWLTAVTYRILRRLLRQLCHYAPRSTTIIITIVITIVPLTIIATTAIVIIIMTVGRQVIFIHITLTMHITIINSIILLRYIIIIITRILWQRPPYHPLSLYNLSCCSLQAQVNQPALAIRRKNNILFHKYKIINN